jgi:lipopolysaccharide cholinephosphotransferase
MITNDYGLAERQAELLSFIKEIDQILEENGIQYSLCGGTLLGAIRHQGFIPWDDDLDIMFDRDNFNKLLDLFQRHNGQVTGSSCKSSYTITRLLWVYRIQRVGDIREGLTAATADVMVMDNCPDSLLARKSKMFLIQMLQGMMHQKMELKDKSLPMKMCLIATYAFGRLFTDRAKYRMYDAVSRLGNGKKTLYLTGYNDLFKTLHCRYTGKLMDCIVRHPFEDTMLPITAEYDNYLLTQYGDYMTPPPLNERIPIHIQ